MTFAVKKRSKLIDQIFLFCLIVHSGFAVFSGTTVSSSRSPTIRFSSAAQIPSACRFSSSYWWTGECLYWFGLLGNPARLRFFESKNTKELRAFLVDEVAAGQIEPDKIKAVCNISQQIYNTMNIEIKVAVASSKLGDAAIMPGRVR